MGQAFCRLEVPMDPRWKARIERYAWLHGLRQNAVVIEALRRYFAQLEDAGEVPDHATAG
ncbi:MAG: hypothetical protein K6U14_10915 [Firmicutes bacterium]|nr:hypothetical protein [Alicyclobacillaceae bacterium]MCL6498123.1 hypothetical protein [Bacillota bacterium]